MSIPRRLASYSFKTSKYWLRDKAVFVSSKRHSCAKAAIINATWTLLGEKVALNVAWAFEKYGAEILFGRLSQLVSYLQKSGAGVNYFEF